MTIPRFPVPDLIRDLNCSGPGSGPGQRPHILEVAP